MILLCFCIYTNIRIYECIRGKEFSYNENGKFPYILSTHTGKKTDDGGKVALSGGIFHNSFVFPIAGENGNLLSDTIKAMNTIKCHVLLNLYVKWLELFCILMTFQLIF